MKILLTGADGFTGRHFIKHAVQAGHDIHELRADLTQPADLTDEVLAAAPDAVVHLAGISFVGHADTSAFRLVNVVGTGNLLEALTRLPVRPLSVLLASSANVYGNTQASPITELQEPMPINDYARSKLEMERVALTYLDRLPLFVTRPFNYIGHGQSDSFVVPKIVKHFNERAPYIELGNLEVEREFNDVGFVCDSYLKLLRSAEAGEVYNICSGNPVNLKSILDLLTCMTGHHIEVRINPAFVRPNEIHRLCGSPQKLVGVVGHVPQPALRETLLGMLEASQHD